MGTFYNVPTPDKFIDNCDGIQAAFLFALPEAGIFQDYNSISGTNTTPSHAFNAKFNVGKSYNLTVGVLGGGGGMKPDATLQLSLYYLDANSNRVTVATTTVTNTSAAFPTNTHLVDYQVQVPGVKAGDPWAGKNIGIQMLSTTGFELAGGYWDLDHVRLFEGIDIPNSSFESPIVPPVAPYAGPDMDSWQKTPQPAWYDPSQNFDTPWSYLMGTFYNVPTPDKFIDNCDGIQAAFLFALPEAGIFQDYNSISGTNTTPSHAFNAKFNSRQILQPHRRRVGRRRGHEAGCHAATQPLLPGRQQQQGDRGHHHRHQYQRRLPYQHALGRLSGSSSGRQSGRPLGRQKHRYPDALHHRL